MPSQVPKGRFQSPGLEHTLQVGVWVFIFPRTLYISLPCVYTLLCVRALGYQGVLPKGLTDVGRTLIYATLTLAWLKHLGKTILPALPELLTKP